MDECCDVRILKDTGRAEIDVAWIRDGYKGTKDPEVLALAETSDRILITEDLDFGGFAARLGRPAPGLILLRLAAKDHIEKTRRLLSIIDGMGDRLYGHYCVVQADKIRIRSMLRTV